MFPVYPNPDDPTEKQFEASSPDEVALVKHAEAMGRKLKERTEQKFTLEVPKANKLNPEDRLGDEFKDHQWQTWEYEILENFPFTSESKCMGILVR